MKKGWRVDQNESDRAEMYARQWRTDGEQAIAHGNPDWAKECFTRAVHWQTLANELRTNPKREFDRQSPRKISVFSVSSGNSIS